MNVHTAVSICFGALVVYSSICYYRLKQQQLKQKGPHNCEPTSELKSKWPLGLDLIVDAFRAASEGHILQFFCTIIENNGTTFEQNLLGARGIDTVSPENIEAVLSSQFKDFGLGVRRQTFFPLLGDGIFTQDGPAWKHSRDMLRPQFMSNRTQTMEQLQKHVGDLLGAISTDKPTDLQQLFFRYTLDTTTSLLFGRSTDSLTKGSSKGEAFADAFIISQDYLAKRGRLGELYWLIGGRKFRDACNQVHSFVDSTITDALRARGERLSGETTTLLNYVFLDALIEETQDPVLLRSTCLNILLAGRDTTACCLSWTFRLLARHPKAYHRLREEIVRVLGDSPVDKEMLKQLPYLQLVLKEVLRLYPSVPVNSRTALRTTTLPRGGGSSGESPILVKKGQAVGYCAYAMHRRKDLYGEDADYFRPERWESTSDDNLSKRIGWGYIPFNGGPRICLGQEFALLEASLAIVRIVQRYDCLRPVDPVTKEELHVEGNSPCGSEPQTLTLVLSSADGCWVRLRSSSHTPNA